MAKQLLRRTSAAPTPRKEAPEPDTYACAGAITAVTEEDSAPLLGICKACKVYASHSEVDHLCYTCHMSKAGFDYDEDKNRYIKKIKRRK
jgi:hypothetical protein